MKPEPTPTLEAAATNTSVAVMVFRMRPIRPRRHRIAHLRALIGANALWFDPQGSTGGLVVRRGGLCRQANDIAAGQRTERPAFSNSNFAKE